MKTIRVVILSVFGLLLLLVTAGFILVSVIRGSGLPVYSGELILKGLESEVTVCRDERGMPHIYASGEQDLYFATGYIMAQERLWQMDLIRRATTGRLSEIFGKDYVQTDLFLRSLDMTAKSKMILDSEDPQILVYLKSFSEGVNAYISDSSNKLSPEFRILGYRPDPWELENTVNIIGYMGWDLASSNLSADIFIYRLIQKFGVAKAGDLIPDWEAGNEYVYKGFGIDEKKLNEAQSFISSMDKLKPLGISSFTGSNNWAVSGGKTVTGMPVLSNDMHLGLNSPGIWYQIHQVIPGKLNVTGVAIPGEPFVVAGHNEKIAWGMTNVMVDDVDLFSERINPDNKDQYQFEGTFRDMKVRKEVINIRGGEPDTLFIKSTHRGPVISGLNGISDAVLTMRWSGNDTSNEIKAVYLLNRASDWSEFRSAISYFSSISQNFAYADVDGNIGINMGGGIPLRKGNGSLIRGGETDEFDWKGYVPFDQLPSVYNPEKGYVSSANNKSVGKDYPFYISFRYCAPYRINRIRQMLEEKQVFGMEDFKRMITDQHSNYAAILMPHILRLSGRESEMNSLEANSLDTLKAWNFDMNKYWVAPSVFEIFTIRLAENLLGDELGDLNKQLPGSLKEYYIYRVLVTGPDEWVDDVNTNETENFDDIVFRSFRESVKVLSEKYSKDINKWKWGNIHTISLTHPMGSVKLFDRLFKLNSDKVGIGGNDNTVCPYSYEDGFVVTSGASERYIYNTADWDESFAVIPTGESGVLSSEFYLSQTKTYLDGKFYRDAYSDEAVKAATKYTLKLKAGN